MGKMKKILAAGVVCYVAYKLGQKYLKENNLTAEDVFDSARKKAEEFAKQAAGVVPTTKDGEPEGKKIYTFGKEKRIEMVHLADGITGLYDNKKNYPIEKKVKTYSEDGGKLYVYSDAADYVISDEPFFMNVYVKDKAQTEAIAIALGKVYDAEEIAVYNYGSSQKFDAQGMAAEAEAEKVAAEQAEAKAKEAELAARAAAEKAEAAVSVLRTLYRQDTGNGKSAGPDPYNEELCGNHRNEAGRTYFPLYTPPSRDVTYSPYGSDSPGQARHKVQPAPYYNVRVHRPASRFFRGAYRPVRQNGLQPLCPVFLFPRESHCAARHQVVPPAARL